MQSDGVYAMMEKLFIAMTVRVFSDSPETM